MAQAIFPFDRSLQVTPTGALADLAISIGTTVDAAASIGMYSNNTPGSELLVFVVGGVAAFTLTPSGASFARVTEAVSTFAGGATFTPNAAVAGMFDVTMDQNLTINAPTNPPAGSRTQKILMILRQGGAGGWTITWNGVFAFSAAVPNPVLSLGAGDYDIIGFVWNPTDGLWNVTGFNKGF